MEKGTSVNDGVRWSFGVAAATSKRATISSSVTFNCFLQPILPKKSLWCAAKQATNPNE